MLGLIVNMIVNMFEGTCMSTQWAWDSSLWLWTRYHKRSAKNYESGYGYDSMDLVVIILALIACFISYQKWAQMGISRITQKNPSTFSARKLNNVLGLIVNTKINLWRNITLTPNPYPLIGFSVDWKRRLWQWSKMVIHLGLLIMLDPVAEMRGDFADGKC